MADTSLLALPVWRLKKNAAGHLALYPRADMAPGDGRPTCNSLVAAGLATPGASPEGFVPDVLVVDGRGALFFSTVHVDAVRLLCGDDGVAALRAAAAPGPCTMTASAWLVTGGDGEQAAEGLQGLLHTIDRKAS